MNILILNGPNLNMLGKRELDIYGTKSYADLEKYLQELAVKYEIKVEVRQTNYEGILIDMIQYANDHYDGVILNAGAFTHYSYALHDAIKSINIPTIEVHLSDISKREPFRQVSVIKDACTHTFMGEGFESYNKGILQLLKGSEQS